MEIHHVAVFCGSNLGTDPSLSSKIISLADKLLTEGWGLVYGGGHRGLMGEISSYMLEHGAHTIGVSPKRFYKPGDEEYSTEFHLVEGMHERKAKMYELADAFIILPGGIGTLDEFFEIYTWKQIGFHTKNIILLNIKDFFTPLLDWLDGLVEKGFLSREVRESLIVCSSCTQVLAALEQEEKKLPDKVSE